MRLGLDPGRILVVGDREEELADAIAEGLEADVCICSGGLGPTHDDRTIELVSRLTGRPLHVDEPLEREIEAVSRSFARRLGRPYHDFAPGVRKQASVPEGAVILGLAGTAPGVLLEHAAGRIVIALPGPPIELQRLWVDAVAAPAFRRMLERVRPRTHRILRFFGPSESSVARALAEAGGEGGGLEVTVCARDFEIHVDLYAEEGAEARRETVEKALRAAFGTHLFAEDERPVEETVLALAKARGVTIATAESCTGGLVGARLTSVPGSSDAYVGGVVAYSDGVKEGQLGVPREPAGAPRRCLRRVGRGHGCGRARRAGRRSRRGRDRRRRAGRRDPREAGRARLHPRRGGRRAPGHAPRPPRAIAKGSVPGPPHGSCITSVTFCHGPARKPGESRC